MIESGLTSKTFSGVRFALVGFNPTDENMLRSKLMSGGGVDVGQYAQSCTHLIVDKLVYDDPICVAARSSGKMVVTGSWVHHSFDAGMVIDANSVLYRPLRDLNGIPGSKSLIVCLTGYQRQDREDIMTMVDLMGGQFSKPLVANRVTHLICYKFEGEKYELAKRMKRIKLVNHRWLEDCLKNWKLLPEVDYEISGHELEMMEASARDSEDEAEDASVKRANTSPLGLRVGAVAAVEMSKSKGKDIPPVVQTNLDEQGGSSRFNTSKEDWLTPKKMEATVSTGPVTAQQSAGTFQNTSSYASPVNKTMDKMETDESTPINVSVRRHTSLATYSRKILQRSSETSTLGNESSCQNRTLKLDDRALKASSAFNISASKSGSSVERTTLFEDLDKLHDKESTPLLPQAKLTDGPVSNKGSEKIHHSSEATLFEDLDKLHGEESTPLLPQAKLTDGSVRDKGSEKIHHSSEASIPPPAMLTAENIISKCARERSSTEPMVGNILLQEPRSGSPKQNLRVVPSINDNSEETNGVLKEADKWTAEAVSLKGALDEVPERSVTAEPVMMRSRNSPGSGLTGMKDQVETEQPKKKTAPRKSLGTRGRKKNPINQKGSIYLSEPTPKDEHTVGLIKGEVSAPATDNGNQKETSSPVLNSEAVLETTKRNDSETDAVERIDSDKLQDKSPEEANAEVEITVLEPERTDDPSDGALQLEVKKSKTKRTSEATVGKNSLQSGGKKGSSSTAEVGNSGVKKTKKSRKGDDAKANDTVVEDTRDKSGNEVENFALENELGKVSSDGDQSPAAGETLVSTEAETKDPSDAAVQPEVDKNNGKRIGEATVGKTRLQSGKKRGSSAVEKASIKKAKKSKKDDETEANDTVVNDIEIESAEAKENAAVASVARKSLARQETAAKKSSNDAMQLEVPKNKRKNKKESTVECSSLQSGEKESSCTAEVGTSSVKKTKKSKKESVAKASDTVMKDVEDNSAEEENTAVDDNKSGRDKGPRKKAAKSAKTGAKVVKESKQLSSGKKALQEQKQEPKHFIVSGPKVQRKEYQKIIRLLKGKCCRDSHQWSYQATHFIAPEIRRTEKFFAAAASGSWILKTDYVADSKEAGKLLPEEPYEWHSTDLSADGTISLESPRKWRLVKEQTGHGALNGVRIVVYGDCAIPSLDTLKRAVKAGDGTILATAPPYTRFLNQNTDFALVSPGIPRDDVWIQEFIRNEIPCVLADYIVEYVCKPGYALDKHVLYNTNTWAERSFNKLQRSAED
ncbi:BRCT domain-containing protein At4g02110 isoform X2 [Raphanus sativus]|uniref:BRCT domain-containing protein At4g02110 isoform X2 n=1 Tax=Raphanus sativus TaxID=3726 RepID=A0A6J0MLF4_RAPSA|nr:BRCT domain-containing protein At4g02110 isoform X2 [Raphanus sativus]